jgi:L-fuconolactonase
MHIDAHFHAWKLARADYGWLTAQTGSIYRDISITDWQTQAQAVGVHAGVLVQAAPTLAETQYLLELAAANPCVLGVVGWVDLAGPRAVQQIQRLAAKPKLKGLRPMLHDTPDPDWILQSAVQPALEAMAEHGLVFDALVKPVHVPRLRLLAQRHPQLSIVVDHGAKPAISQAQWQPWADSMAGLAQQPNLSCKLSGLLTEAGPAPAPDAAARYSAHLRDCFGAERLLWGSDWPVLELAASYAAWWQACKTATADLSPQQRKAVFGGNAQRIYGLQATT